MALGAATVANRVNHGAEKVYFDVISFAGDGSYPTGGTAAFEAFVIAAVGRGALDVVAVLSADCGVYRAVYVPSTDKLKVLTEANAEVANATNLAATTFNLIVISK
ncbi:MAG: hypothetical protein M3P47_05980 [Pseudomonadota bacterium]|nr:hypothetical protein [Pseudomonadota bacterium]